MALHPATWHEHRLPAQALVQQMEADLPAGVVGEIQRVASRDVWAAVEEVLSRA